MADKKSRQYSVNGNSYAFEFVGDKLAGIKKSVNGILNPIPPKGSEFASVSSSDESLDAFNVAKFGPNKAAYVDTVEKQSEEELQDYYNKEKNKSDNEQFVENFAEPALAFTSPRDTGGRYDRNNSSYRGRAFYNPITKRIEGGSDIFAYPLDIDLEQDHFKITKYKYVRPNINQSKSARVKNINDEYKNVAGDSVVGSEIDGSVILPMPKATDANAAQWGGSDLTVTDLAALGAAEGLDKFSPARLFGRTSSGLRNDQIREQNEIRRQRAADGQGESFAGNIISTGQANAAQSISKLTGLLGANFDTDVFLARTGGRVLNPNAEMLFQGPVIRDFSFEFQMIARSKKEGEEIRRIVRFFKTGMAPKFQNIAFLANPDVFKLEYRNSKGTLNTVNRFNPGGLALTALKTDYAPNGYWAAYTDSQPVALKLAMSFTELRPIYEGDQAQTPEDSVGY